MMRGQAPKYFFLRTATVSDSEQAGYSIAFWSDPHCTCENFKHLSNLDLGSLPGDVCWMRFTCSLRVSVRWNELEHLKKTPIISRWSRDSDTRISWRCGSFVRRRIAASCCRSQVYTDGGINHTIPRHTTTAHDQQQHPTICFGRRR